MKNDNDLTKYYSARGCLAAALTILDEINYLNASEIEFLVESAETTEEGYRNVFEFLSGLYSKVTEDKQ
jgi:hypothetical protein